MSRFGRKQLREKEKTAKRFGDKFNRLTDLFRAYGFDVKSNRYINWSKKSFEFRINLELTDNNYALIDEVFKGNKKSLSLIGIFRKSMNGYYGKTDTKLSYGYWHNGKYAEINSVDRDIATMVKKLGYIKKN